jgi:hypothetical protein
MSEMIIRSLSLSFVLTIVLEAGFFLIVGKRDKRDFLLLVLVNILTNPIVVLIFWLVAVYTDCNPYIVLIPLEISAVMTEGFYYRKYGRCFSRPFIFSLSANMVSFGVGELIDMLFLKRIL